MTQTLLIYTYMSPIYLPCGELTFTFANSMSPTSLLPWEPNDISLVARGQYFCYVVQLKFHFLIRGNISATWHRLLPFCDARGAFLPCRQDSICFVTRGKHFPHMAEETMLFRPPGNISSRWREQCYFCNHMITFRSWGRNNGSFATTWKTALRCGKRN